MQIETMFILLVMMLLGYMVMTYIKLTKQDIRLKKIKEDLKALEDKDKNTDKLRREYNLIARSFNHTIVSFIGKRIANKKAYNEVDIIDKESVKVIEINL